MSSLNDNVEQVLPRLKMNELFSSAALAHRSFHEIASLLSFISRHNWTVTIIMQNFKSQVTLFAGIHISAPGLLAHTGNTHLVNNISPTISNFGFSMVDKRCEFFQNAVDSCIALRDSLLKRLNASL